MAVSLPTEEDTKVLVKYLQQQLRLHDDNADEQTVVDASETLQGICTAVRQIVDESSTFFSAMDGPVLAPKRFLSQKLPQLVDLHDKAQRQLALLQGEGREHGLSFAPEDVKRRYMQFVDAIASIEQWTLAGLRVAEGTNDAVPQPPSASGGIQMETHDVSSIFIAFHENSLLFFIQECTMYDPRIQRRILMPGYFAALNDHIRELRREIERLKAIEITLRTSTAAPRIVLYRPSLSEFLFLLESLQLYLATSIIEDEVTTLTYYRILYDAVQKDAKGSAEKLAMLPRLTAPPVAGPSTAAAGGASPSTNAAANGEGPNANTNSDAAVINAELICFDEVRHRAYELHANLKRDIDIKNQSHRTRCATGARGVGSAHPAHVAAQPVTPIPPAASTPAPSSGWWSALASASSRLFKGAADVVTCKAEIFSGGDSVDIDGTPISKTSPLAAQKQELLNQVTVLMQAIDAIADGLEQQYPGLYHKDWKTRLQRAGGSVFQKLESMTVVFKS